MSVHIALSAASACQSHTWRPSRVARATTKFARASSANKCWVKRPVPLGIMRAISSHRGRLASCAMAGHELRWRAVWPMYWAYCRKAASLQDGDLWRLAFSCTHRAPHRNLGPFFGRPTVHAERPPGERRRRDVKARATVAVTPVAEA